MRSPGELVVEIRRRTRRTEELEAEIVALVEGQAPAPLELKGCGALTAAKPIAETARTRRLARMQDSLVSPVSHRSRPRASAPATTSTAAATAS